VAARHGWMIASVAGLVVVADQVTKQLVRERFELYESVSVVPGFFNLTRVHNTGAAFGMLDGMDFAFKAGLLSLVAVAALVFLTLYALSVEPGQQLTRLGLALIIGGAAGNLVDRVSAGYVLDFFDFYWRGWHFWAFNVADAAITVGVALMILDMLPWPAAPDRRVPGPGPGSGH
jgi:signal peptidase II